MNEKLQRWLENHPLPTPNTSDAASDNKESGK